MNRYARMERAQLNRARDPGAEERGMESVKKGTSFETDAAETNFFHQRKMRPGGEFIGGPERDGAFGGTEDSGEESQPGTGMGRGELGRKNFTVYDSKLKPMFYGREMWEYDSVRGGDVELNGKGGGVIPQQTGRSLKRKKGAARPKRGRLKNDRDLSQEKDDFFFKCQGVAFLPQ